METKDNENFEKKISVTFDKIDDRWGSLTEFWIQRRWVHVIQAIWMEKSRVIAG